MLYCSLCSNKINLFKDRYYKVLAYQPKKARMAINSKRFITILILCQKCAEDIFTFEELQDYVEKGKDRPKHFGWIRHKGSHHQGSHIKEVMNYE